MTTDKKVDVVIPIYKPGNELLDILYQLCNQTYPVNRIILINTEEKYFDKKYIINNKIEVYHINKTEFDHGATRDLGIKKSNAKYVLFLTMDSVPADDKLIYELVNGFTDNTAVVYGRQLPKKNCRLTEQYTRFYNYPDTNCLKNKQKLKKLGIKTYFCSDVCAMYDTDIYKSLGGFENPIIFNEDMIYAARAINAGYDILYCARAEVFHSHNYTLKEQFHRNFDLGVSQAMYPEIFKSVKSESEGIQMIKKTMAFLLKKGHWYDIPYLVLSSAFKFLGYKKGIKYKKYSRKRLIRYSMNKEYWKE